jgi:hypothetical protein
MNGNIIKEKICERIRNTEESLSQEGETYTQGTKSKAKKVSKKLTLADRGKSKYDFRSTL